MLPVPSAINPSIYPHLDLDVGFSAAEVILRKVLVSRLFHLAEAREAEGTLVCQLLVILVEAHLHRYRLLCGGERKGDDSAVIFCLSYSNPLLCSLSLKMSQNSASSYILSSSAV